MNASLIVFDTIVQGATVDLLHSYGVAAAPLSVSTGARFRPRRDVLGFVTFNSPSLNGSLTLSLDEAVLASLRGAPAGSLASHDVLRELTNQLVGRLKNRLIRFQITLRVGMPSVVGTDALAHARPPTDRERLYVVRTIRGDVSVCVDAALDAALAYSSAVYVPTEGELIEL
jgi:hypothetical protein